MLNSVDGKVQRIQWMLYAEASNDKDKRFKQVYRFLNQSWWVEPAIDVVLRNRGSRTAGIDGATREDYLEDEQRRKLKDRILENLLSGQYRPQPVRRVYIKKANGKLRPLGIPTIQDRVVQQMVKMLMEPIYEGTFLSCSYGFRPNRCTWDAIVEAQHYLRSRMHYDTIIEGDITNCFGTIPHSRLMSQLQRRIQDKRLLALIWEMLQAGYMEDLQYHETVEGTPQGGIVSPLLANVYLHQLDEWMHQRFHAITSNDRERLNRHGEFAYVRYIRYADDFIVLTRHSEQAAAFKQELTDYIAQELLMTLSADKTLITQAQAGFNFLGVCICVRPRRNNPEQLIPYVSPSDKSVQAFRHKVKEITCRQLDYVPAAERIRALNWLTRGWAEYHHWGNAKRTFVKLTLWTSQKVLTMLERCVTPGKKNAYRKHLIPISNCINLRQWKRYTVWRTPAVELEGGMHLGLIPLAIISTQKYWLYRGYRIPPAFQSPLDETTWNVRDTDILTDLEVIQNTQLNETPQAVTLYDTAYMVNRKRALQRDRYTCVKCGYKSQRQLGEVHDLEIHHIDPNGGNGLDNLQTVCLPCHRQLTAL